jgi:hypothetical protein
MVAIVFNKLSVSLIIPRSAGSGGGMTNRSIKEAPYWAEMGIFAVTAVKRFGDDLT